MVDVLAGRGGNTLCQWDDCVPYSDSLGQGYRWEHPERFLREFIPSLSLVKHMVGTLMRAFKRGLLSYEEVVIEWISLRIFSCSSGFRASSSSPNVSVLA